MFENRVFRRIFQPERDKLTGEWRKLQNEEVNDLYSSPNTVRVRKLRRMRWAGHVICMGERRGIYKVLVGKPKGETDHLEDTSKDGRIILRWIFRKWYGGTWTLLIWFRIGAAGRHL